MRNFRKTTGYALLLFAVLWIMHLIYISLNIKYPIEVLGTTVDVWYKYLMTELFFNSYILAPLITIGMYLVFSSNRKEK
jgi:hypothetical protein